MNKTSIVLILLLLALLSYTINTELDHRKEINIKNEKIAKQQKMIQEWKKLGPRIEKIREERELLWVELDTLKADIIEWKETNDSKTK